MNYPMNHREIDLDKPKTYLVISRAAAKDPAGPCVQSTLKSEDWPASDYIYYEEIVKMYRTYFAEEPDRVAIVAVPWIDSDGPTTGFGVVQNRPTKSDDSSIPDPIDRPWPGGY